MYKTFKELSKTDIDQFNRKELTAFVERVLVLLSGGNYEEVKYSKISVTMEHDDYDGSDIDGYSLPRYKMRPVVTDLYEKANLLREACEEEYRKRAAQPISREEYDRLLEKWDNE
jgi:hypothetical protein